MIKLNNINLLKLHVMKKFLFGATLVSVSLTGCVNDNEAVLNPEDNPQPITFEVAKYKSSSRAGEEGAAATNSTGATAYDTDLTFGTYAFIYGPTPEVEAEPEVTNNAYTYSTYMDNEEIKYYSQGNFWGAVENPYSYIWPTTGHIDFISYAPYNADATNPAVPRISHSASGNHSYDILSYEGFKVDENRVDLLYADKAVGFNHNVQQQFGFTGVTTLFHHALAKLTILVKAGSDASVDGSTYWEVTINSLSLNNVYTAGNLTLKLSNNAHNDGTNEIRYWVNTRTDGNNVWIADPTSNKSRTWRYPHVLTTNAVAYGSTVTTEFGAYPKDFYVLPQVLNAGLTGQSMTINYDIKSLNPDGTLQNEAKGLSKTVVLETLAVKNWELGKHITYVVSIDPAGDVIHFDPGVSAWENVENTDVDM